MYTISQALCVYMCVLKFKPCLVEWSKCVNKPITPTFIVTIVASFMELQHTDSVGKPLFSMKAIAQLWQLQFMLHNHNRRTACIVAHFHKTSAGKLPHGGSVYYRTTCTLRNHEKGEMCDLPVYILYSRYSHAHLEIILHHLVPLQLIIYDLVQTSF